MWFNFFHDFVDKTINICTCKKFTKQVPTLLHKSLFFFIFNAGFEMDTHIFFCIRFFRRKYKTIVIFHSLA